MLRFHKVEDAAVITLCRGIYRQCALYRRGNDLYALHGGGFLRLCAKGGTSVPHVSWKDIDPGPGASFSEAVFTVTITLPATPAIAAE